MSRSVQRALTILQSIAESPKGVSEISREMKISKGTIFSLMKELESQNFIKQDQTTYKYLLGNKLLKMASSQLNNMDICTVAEPYLQELADETSEIVNLAVRDNFSVLFLLRLESRKVYKILRLMSRVGSNSPLHCTSVGKVILTAFSTEEFKQFVKSSDFRSYTDQTMRCDPQSRQYKFGF